MPGFLRPEGWGCGNPQRKALGHEFAQPSAPTTDKEAGELGLTHYEYAFYTAVADNDSTREPMQKDILRDPTVVPTRKVRENTTLDWNSKESVCAQPRAISKRTLRQYGSPPDMEQRATDTATQQAQMIADELLQSLLDVF